MKRIRIVLRWKGCCKVIVRNLRARLLLAVPGDVMIRRGSTGPNGSPQGGALKVPVARVRPMQTHFHQRRPLALHLILVLDLCIAGNRR